MGLGLSGQSPLWEGAAPVFAAQFPLQLALESLVPSGQVKLLATWRNRQASGHHYLGGPYPGSWKSARSATGGL